LPSSTISRYSAIVHEEGEEAGRQSVKSRVPAAGENGRRVPIPAQAKVVMVSGGWLAAEEGHGRVRMAKRLVAAADVPHSMIRR
jgi:hypothetical protein